MKRIFFISRLVMGLFAALITSSCENDLLDKQPLDIISDKSLWSDPALIEAYISQQYAQTPTLIQDSWELSTGNFGKNLGGPFYFNSLSDESKNNWTLGSSGPAGFKNGGLRIGGGLSEYWDLGYRTIRQLNEIIERLPSTPLAASVKKNRLAEARFLRAFNYFSLVKRYGAVPLITKVQTLEDPKETLSPVRDSEQRIYDFIIAELDATIQELPETYAAADYGRPTKFAALSFKSRAALYAGSIAKYGTVQLNGLLGIPSSQATSYFTKSLEASKVIVSSGRHSLYRADADRVKNFRNVFLIKKNPEAIFVVTHNNGLVSAGNPWTWDYGQSPKPHPIDQGNINAPYLEMAEAFEYVDGKSGKLNYDEIQTGLWSAADLWKNKDPRFYATLYTQDTQWKGTAVDFHDGLITSTGQTITSGSFGGVLARGIQQGNQGNVTGFGVMKYLDETTPLVTFLSNSTTDYQVFRYAEILLNLAEAAFEIGNSADALDAINQIRNRAGIAPHTTISIERIRQERRVELAFENHRYWDLRRWRTAVRDLSINNSALRYILDFNTKKYRLQVIRNADGTTSTPAFFEFNYYFPINNGRRQANPNLVENPGYN
jgi:hypothetical protein